jgi:hypothetical protein
MTEPINLTIRRPLFDRIAIKQAEAAETLERMAEAAAKPRVYHETGPQTGYPGRRWWLGRHGPLKKGQIVPRMVVMNTMLNITGKDWRLVVWWDVAPERFRVYFAGNDEDIRGVLESLIYESETPWTQLQDAWEDDRAQINRQGWKRGLGAGSAITTPNRRGAASEYKRTTTPPTPTLTFGNPPARSTRKSSRRSGPVN